jgi:putative mRNA 3-end processing factor
MSRGFKAVIDRTGAILLGDTIVCDAHADRPLRIVTHGHTDHTGGLNASMQRCQQVLMTPATRDLIHILYGLPAGHETVLRTLSYGERLQCNDDKLTFFNAGHILGSAQVLVEDDEGTRIVYTGDFKLPEAVVVPADLLVIEATYGKPANRRPFKHEVEHELVRLVRERLREGNVFIFGYHGKVQEVIRTLTRAEVEAPILVPRRIYEVTQLYEQQEGGFSHPYYQLGTPLASEAMRGAHIVVHHLRSAANFTGRGTRIYLSGWEFERPCKRLGEAEYLVAWSDHADFDELLNYVQESRPRFVITDRYRVGGAAALAREIMRRLGIPSSPMP